MLMWHITLAPLALIVLTVWHVLQVRRRGVVPPLPPPRRGGTPRPPAVADAPTPAPKAPLPPVTPAGEGAAEPAGGPQ